MTRPPPSRLLLSVAAFLVAGTCVRLGIWQVSRDGERNAGRARAQEVASLPILSTLEGDPAWRHVSLRGKFTGESLLEAGIERGEVYGYEVWSPFRTQGGVALVDRGWVPAEGLESSLAVLPAPSMVDGQARPGRGSSSTEVRATRGELRIWPRGATAAMLAASGASVLVVQPPGGKWVPDYDGTSIHYAFQWFGIAAMTLALWGWGMWRGRA